MHGDPNGGRCGPSLLTEIGVRGGSLIHTAVHSSYSRPVRPLLSLPLHIGTLEAELERMNPDWRQSVVRVQPVRCGMCCAEL